MAVGISNCIKRSSSMTVAQKGLPSRVHETYLLEIGGSGAESVSLKDIENFTFTGATPPMSDKPVMRTRLASDNRFVLTQITYRPITVCTWEMQCEYTGLLYVGATDAEDPASEHWFRLSRRATQRLVPMWVYPSTFPTNYAAAWPPTTPVSGTQLDMMGQPEQVRTWFHSFQIEIHEDLANDYANSSSSNYWPMWWTTKLFKRNSVAFLGYDPGLVVFKGFSQAMTEDPWATFILEFEADGFGHLEQRVIPNVTGGVLMTGTATWGASIVKQANAAYWYQPYTRSGALIDFDILSPAGHFNELTVPTPSWP